MRLVIHNLGAIKEAEIELKPLTVFIGPNNSGKSWIAYTLVAVLGPQGYQEYTRAYTAGELEVTYPRLDQAMQHLLDEGNASIDLVQFAEEYAEIYLNHKARFARSWLQDFLATERVSFDHLEITVSLESSRKRLLEALGRASLDQKLSVGRQRETGLVNLLKEPGKPLLYLYTTTEGNILDKLPFQIIQSFVMENILLTLHAALYPGISTFPTERTAFVNYPPEARDQEEPSLVLRETPYGVSASNPLSVPTRRFLHMMHAAFDSSQGQRSRQAAENPAIQRSIELAGILEKRILGGTLDFSTTEPDPQREILFQTADGVTLDMPIVSSMVKELAPLVLHLRYLARPGGWLIIDEPEMNLHPRAQAQITEWLAMLVNAGLHVLITTHSPYMLDHLGNLLAAARSEAPDSLAAKFFLKSADAFLAPEKVAAYLIDEGTAQNALDEEKIIDWGTFADISERLVQLYFEIS
jgi:energy-coupling factor transporter ATP-binding protein EcfA2